MIVAILLLLLPLFGSTHAGAEGAMEAVGAFGASGVSGAPAESRIALQTGLEFQIFPEDVLLPCPFGYYAEVCASELNPGFEFIPVDGPVVFTGETLAAAAQVHTIRIEVELESGGPSVVDAMATIQAVLGHSQGWTARGRHAFRHLASDAPDLAILIATPESVDRLCAPLDTEGYFSCRVGGRAVLNVERWNAAVPHWTSSLEDYRAYLINHEVGHYLGMGHALCPSSGEPAPVMQQQSIDLMGCEPNGWPYR